WSVLHPPSANNTNRLPAASCHRVLSATFLMSLGWSTLERVCRVQGQQTIHPSTGTWYLAYRRRLPRSSQCPQRLQRVPWQGYEYVRATEEVVRKFFHAESLCLHIIHHCAEAISLQNGSLLWDLIYAGCFALSTASSNIFVVTDLGRSSG